MPGPPASRVSDMHVCPMVTGIIPHVGGPVLLGCFTALFCKLPGARVSDMCFCVGPPDTIVLGSFKTLTGKMPQARMGSLTAHGGTVVVGAPTTLVG
ncbi:MAG: PAAR domain-containing protein [Pseudomonadota bacterium]